METEETKIFLPKLPVGYKYTGEHRMRWRGIKYEYCIYRQSHRNSRH